MIDALEKSFILRDLADRVYYLRNLSAYKNKNPEVSEAIADELDNIVLELAEMLGVDFAANWRTDRPKLPDFAEVILTIKPHDEDHVPYIVLANYSAVARNFDVRTNGSEDYIVGWNDIAAWMPAPKPFRKEKQDG